MKLLPVIQHNINNDINLYNPPGYVTDKYFGVDPKLLRNKKLLLHLPKLVIKI